MIHINNKNCIYKESIYTTFILAISLLLLLNTIALVLDIKAWRHDMLQYLPDYTWNLVHDGRWINYLLFDYIRLINAHISYILCLIAFGLFITYAANKVTRSYKISLLIALLALQSPPLHMQLLWPIVTLPALIILASSIYFHSKIKRYLFFTIYGTLFFATYSNFYFFLPLLFLNTVTNEFENRSFYSNTINTVKNLLIPWMTGFIAGYLFASFILFLSTGTWGIQIEEWREPNYITDLYSLTNNIDKSTSYIIRDLYFIYNLIGIELITFSFSLLLYSLLTQRVYYIYIIIPLLILLSIYISTIPVGIRIDTRSVISTWVGLIFLFLIPLNASKKGSIIYSTIILLLALKFHTVNTDNLNWYTKVVDIYISETEKVIEYPIENYKGIIMLGNDDEFSNIENIIQSKHQLNPTYEIKHLSSPSRWRPSALELGFQEVIICNRGKHKALCDSATAQSEKLHLQNAEDLFKSLKTDSGWLIIAVNPDFSIL